MSIPDYHHSLTGPFWQGAAQHELRLSWCRPCAQAIWYPQAACPHCGGALHWHVLSGDALLITWSEVAAGLNPHFSEAYISALVSPVEAPTVRLVTRMVQCAAQDLRCDMPVTVRFEKLQQLHGEPYVAPCFTVPQG
ncbi:MAG: zinc ribbon domain-containing protein [Haliea sp.]|nr:zinc ribbon domain-containing protein [Haliea sp.]